MSEVRQVMIRGDAAAAYTKEPRKSRNTRKQREAQEGGTAAAAGATNIPSGNQIVHSPSNLSRAAGITRQIAMTGGAGPLPPAGPEPVVPKNIPAVTAAAAPPVPAAAAAPQQTGGKKSKLVLAPPKRKTMHKSRLHLAAPSGFSRRENSSESRKESKDYSLHKDHKKTRKIRVHLGGMKKRLTHAKTIHKDSRDKPIAEVRRLLEEAKLINKSKNPNAVPDSVLRDIYRDYLLLRNRVL
jgi:hypothetical protein